MKFKRISYIEKIPSSYTLYIRTRGITRDTTLIRKLLTQFTFASVRQHSSALNVHHSVTAYWHNPAFGVKLRDVFPYLLSARLSSPGCFLCIPQIGTCSRLRFQCFNCIYYRHCPVDLSTVLQSFLHPDVQLSKHAVLQLPKQVPVQLLVHVPLQFAWHPSLQSLTHAAKHVFSHVVLQSSPRNILNFSMSVLQSIKIYFLFNYFHV